VLVVVKSYVVKQPYRNKQAAKGMYHILLTYFHGIIDAVSVTSKNDVITHINTSDSDVRIVDRVFQFTLRGLYTQLCNDAFTDIPSYVSFRSMLYASELNKDLSKVGYFVQVHYSTTKVDSSWYELVLLPHTIDGVSNNNAML